MEAPRCGSSSQEERLTFLLDALEYRFNDPALLSLALCALQSSLSPETATARQRLEFLGDAAWNFAVAAAAFHAWPAATVGDLTRFRAAWCSTEGLARLARRFGVPASEDSCSGPSQRVLAEMLEAVLGAMVEDGGFEAVRRLAHRLLTRAALAASPPPLDPKSTLQLLAQARHLRLPAYRLLERRGPPHQPTFRVQVVLRDEDVDVQAEGEGFSRQAAEQEAARLALLRVAECSDALAQDLVVDSPPRPQT